MISSLNSRLNAILKKRISPFLRELGFKKRQLIYSRKTEDINWLVDIQKSRWNSETEAQFTLNFGVYVPGVLSIYAKIADPENPRIEHCSCSARVGMLTPSRKDIWWKLTKDDPERVDCQVANELLEKIQNTGISFLTMFNRSLEVADFLSSELDKKYSQVSPLTRAQRLAYSGIIYSKLGIEEKGQAILDSAVEASKNSPIEEIIWNLRQDLYKGR